MHVVVNLQGFRRWGILSAKGGAMFMRIQDKRAKDGTVRHYASLVRGDRVDGRVVQTTVAYLGRVDEDQIPFLKAAYAKRKPKLVWDDDED